MNTPYFKNPGRLSDIISAIQAMSTYKFYKLDFKGWADRISGDEGKADYWRDIFVQHPEFFRLDSKREKASLVWRRQYPKRFHVDLERKLSNDEFDQLDDEIKRTRVSRNPLQSEDIQALIETAISLNAKELEHRQEKRWWIPGIISLIGGLLGALIGGLLKS